MIKSQSLQLQFTQAHCEYFFKRSNCLFAVPGVSDEEDSAKSDDETEDLREEEKTAQKQQQDGSLVKEEEREVGVVKLHVYKSYWLAVGHCLATSILLALLLMQGK